MENKQGGMVNGKSHDEGGEKFVVKSTGQLVELEGGEGVVNKKNMAMEQEFTITGTPREIVSCVNEIDGNGVNFRDDNSKCDIKKLQDGGTVDSYPSYKKELNLSEAEKEKVFALPLESAVYVPSTTDVSNSISVDELTKRVDEVKAFLAGIFGGYTQSENVGGYVDSNGKLVNEKIVKVTSFSTANDFYAKRDQLMKKLAEWASRWGQEAMGLEFEGDLYYVPASFGRGGILKTKSSLQRWNKMVALVGRYSRFAAINIDHRKQEIIVVADNKILTELLNFGGRLQPVDPKSKFIVWHYANNSIEKKVYSNESEFAKGGELSGIDPIEVEKSAQFYTAEGKWSPPRSIGHFQSDIKEYQELKRKLDNKEIAPSKIIGKGIKPQFVRPLAYRWIEQQIAIAKRAIEILQERANKTNDGGAGSKLSSGGQIYNEHLKGKIH